MKTTTKNLEGTRGRSGKAVTLYLNTELVKRSGTIARCREVSLSEYLNGLMKRELARQKDKVRKAEGAAA